MRKETINGHRFEFYDSIDELPISQFHKYSKYILVDSGVGSDIASIDSHIGKILQFIGVDDEKARREVMNLRRSIYMAVQEEDTRNKGYLCLTHKVDGRRWEDFSDCGLDELYLMVQSESVKRMLDIFGEIKNRLDGELGTYFPEVFSTSTEKNYQVLARKRALLQLATILEDTDNEKEIKKLTEQMLRYSKPKSFEEDSENAEVRFDKQFETMCLAMSKEFGGMVKGYTVMEFYSAYEALERQSKEMEKIKSRRNK